MALKRGVYEDGVFKRTITIKDLPSPLFSSSVPFIYPYYTYTPRIILVRHWTGYDLGFHTFFLFNFFLCIVWEN